MGLARKAKCDVFFFPTLYSYFLLSSRAPCIICYHDATAEWLPEIAISDQAKSMASAGHDCPRALAANPRDDRLASFGPGSRDHSQVS